MVLAGSFICTCHLYSITMSETNTPVNVVFDLQRTAIEQTNEALTRGVEAQQEYGERLVDFGPAKQASEQSYDALRTLVDSYFEAVDATMPGQQDLLDDLRTTFDDQLDTLEATQVEAIEAVEANVQDGNELTEELLEEFVETLDEQFETMLEANADVEEQTVEAVRDVEGNIEELQAEFEAQSEEIAENFQAYLDQFQAQVAEVQQEVEAVTDEISETTEAQVETAVEATDESLQTIDGLGPTYAERLHEQGIESLGALAAATAETVAAAADVSETQAESWIETARAE